MNFLIQRMFLHEWFHLRRGFQFWKGWQNKKLKPMRFLFEAEAELFTKDFYGSGSSDPRVDLPDGEISIKDIREKGFFHFDQSPVHSNKAYYSAYLWFQRLLAGGEQRVITKDEFKRYLDATKNCATPEEFDQVMLKLYPSYAEAMG